MHRARIATSLFVSAFTGLAVVACSGSGATTVPSIAIPSIAIPSIAVPSITLPSIAIPSIDLPSGLPSITIPSIDIPSIPPIPSIAIPSLDTHQAPDLEALLPSQLRGTTLEKLSLAGDAFANSGSTTDPQFQAILTQFNKTAADFAFAGANDPSSTLKFDLTALRLAGVDANQLLSAFVTAGLTGSASAKPAISTATISGKAVTVLTDSAGKKQYAYPRGDVLFIVASDAADADALVADIFAALP